MLMSGGFSGSSKSLENSGSGRFIRKTHASAISSLYKNPAAVPRFPKRRPVAVRFQSRRETCELKPEERGTIADHNCRSDHKDLSACKNPKASAGLVPVVRLLLGRYVQPQRVPEGQLFPPRSRQSRSTSSSVE